MTFSHSLVVLVGRKVRPISGLSNGTSSGGPFSSCSRKPSQVVRGVQPRDSSPDGALPDGRLWLAAGSLAPLVLARGPGSKADCGAYC